MLESFEPYVQSRTPCHRFAGFVLAIAVATTLGLFGYIAF